MAVLTYAKQSRVIITRIIIVKIKITKIILVFIDGQFSRIKSIRGMKATLKMSQKIITLQLSMDEVRGL